jgi:hypothetical protein
VAKQELGCVRISRNFQRPEAQADDKGTNTESGETPVLGTRPKTYRADTVDDEAEHKRAFIPIAFEMADGEEEGADKVGSKVSCLQARGLEFVNVEGVLKVLRAVSFKTGGFCFGGGTLLRTSSIP